MEINWGTTILSFILTAVAYLAFPIIKLVINQGKFERKRAHKIALWNSIVLGLFFCILTIDQGGVWNAAPAFLYYAINCAILTDKSLKDATPETTNQSITDEANPSITTGETVAENQPDAPRFCRKCGNKLIDGALFCNMCGTKIITDQQGEE